MPYYAGKLASFSFAGTVFTMDSWTLDENVEEVEVTNFATVDPTAPLNGAVRTVIPGVPGGTFTASGPYSGAAPLKGTYGMAVFGAGQGNAASRSVLITNVKISTQVKDKATLEISGSITPIP